MITKLSVQHYRSIEALELSMGPVNVFVGPNSAGKTNIIDALKFVRDALQNGLDQAVTERHGIQSVRQWSPTKPYHVTLSVEIRPNALKARGYFTFTLGSSGNEYIILNEEANWTNVRRVVRRQRDGSTEAHEDRISISYARKKNGEVLLRENDRDSPRRLDVDNINDLFLSSRFSLELMQLRRHLTNFENLTAIENEARTLPGERHG